MTENESYGDYPSKIQIRNYWIRQIKVNPQQLYNRILCISDSPSKLNNYLEYELASKPTPVFDEVSFS